MDITDEIISGFDYLPKTTSTINNKAVDVLFNQSVHRDNKTLGGYELDNESIVYVKTKDLTNPLSLKGKTMTLNSQEWRIISIRTGGYITHLTVISVDKL
jgi:non-homologous end joining protein Ku